MNETQQKRARDNIGAAAITDIPTLVSELINDLGYITNATFPVTSVNGLTGEVVVTTSHINEGSNLYYTEARVSANATVLANYTKLNDGSLEELVNKGQPLGYAPLDGSGLISSTFLPSYVDDVLEYADFGSLPNPGESGKIYITLDDNATYRWGGSAYVPLSSGGEQSSGGSTYANLSTNYEYARDLGLTFSRGDFQEEIIAAVDDATYGGFHALRYITLHKSLYALSRSNPTLLFKFSDPSDLSIYTTVDLSITGFHFSDQLIYDDEKDRLYCAMSDKDYTSYELKIWEINPDNLAKLLIIDYDTVTEKAGSPTLQVLDGYLYVTNGYYSPVIYKFNLTNFAYTSQVRITAPLSTAHACATDGYYLYYSSLWDFGDGAFIARVDPVGMTVDQLHKFAIDEASTLAGITDDILVVGDNLYLPSEYLNKNVIYVANKNNLTELSMLEVGISSDTNDLWSIHYDGVDIWYAGQGGSLGKFNPNTLKNYTYTNPFTYNINEMYTDGKVIYVTGFDVYPVSGTGYVGRMTNPNSPERRIEMAGDGTPAAEFNYTSKEWVYNVDETQIDGFVANSLVNKNYLTLRYLDLATYDPTAVGGDAFDMDNMAEGTDTKILTAAERTTLSSISAYKNMVDVSGTTASTVNLETDSFVYFVNVAGCTYTLNQSVTEGFQQELLAYGGDLTLTDGSGGSTIIQGDSIVVPQDSHALISYLPTGEWSVEIEAVTVDTDEWLTKDAEIFQITSSYDTNAELANKGKIGWMTGGTTIVLDKTDGAGSLPVGFQQQIVNDTGSNITISTTDTSLQSLADPLVDGESVYYVLINSTTWHVTIGGVGGAAGGGDVLKTGSLANNYLTHWSNDTTVTGDVNLQWDGSALDIVGKVAVAYSGTDSLVTDTDASGSTISTNPVYRAKLPATGNQIAYAAISTSDTDYWTKLQRSAGGTDKPGILLGSGATSPDTNLYRDSADTLKTDDSLVIAGNLTVTTDPTLGTHVGDRDYNDLRYSQILMGIPTDITAATYTALPTDSGNTFHGVAHATGTVITFDDTAQDYSEGEVYNFWRSGVGALEIVGANGITFEGVDDGNGDFLVNDQYSGVTIIMESATHGRIMGNLTRELGSGTGDLLAANNLSDVNSAASARTNLGVDIAGTDNYVSWDLKTDGTQRLAVTNTNAVDIVGGSNVTVTYSATGVVTLAAVGGSGATNLSWTASPTTGLVASDTGTDATISLATGTNSGLMSPAHYTSVEGIASSVTKSGTPVDNQVAVFTGDGIIEGTTGLTYDGTDLDLTGSLRATVSLYSASSFWESGLGSTATLQWSGNKILFGASSVTGADTKEITLANASWMSSTATNTTIGSSNFNYITKAYADTYYLGGGSGSIEDGDFTSNGIMVRTGVGTYGTIIDNSVNWSSAYTHSQIVGNGHSTVANDIPMTGYVIPEASGSIVPADSIDVAIGKLEKGLESATVGSGDPNVQSNWTETSTGSDAYILNKPDLSVYANINGSYLEQFRANTLVLENEELVDVNIEGEVGFDLNDEAATVSTAAADSYTGTNPLGLYVSDGVGTAARVWHSQHFGNTDVTNWGTAYTHSQVTHAPSNAEANPALVAQATAETGTSTTEYMWSALRVAQAIAAQGQGTDFDVTDGDGTNISFTTGDTLNFIEAGGININFTDTTGPVYGLSINHLDTSSFGMTALSGAAVISDINVDGYGHVTSVSTRNLTASNLSDVTISSIATGEMLQWNGSAWVNQTLAEIGISGYTHPNHSGHVTSTGDGATVLTAAAITTQTPGTVLAGADEILYSDNGTIKKIDLNYLVKGFTDIGANIVGTDEMLISDAGNIRRTDVSRLLTYMQSNLTFTSYTAAELLTLIKTVDGPGSGLDADTLDGLSSGSFLRSTANAVSATKLATARTIDITGDITATAVAFDGTANIAISASVNNDSHTHDGRYYTETESNARYLGITATAADSSELGGQLASSYLRSNATDYKNSGSLIFSDNIMSAWGTGSDITMRWDQTKTRGTMVMNAGTGLHIFDGATQRFEFARTTGYFECVKAFATSSRALKKNIVPWGQSGISIINNIDVVTYDWKEEGKRTDNIGAIAEDVPDEIAADDRKSIDIYTLAFVQTKAIQELSKKNDDLEERLARLENLIQTKL